MSLINYNKTKINTSGVDNYECVGEIVGYDNYKANNEWIYAYYSGTDMHYDCIEFLY